MKKSEDYALEKRPFLEDNSPHALTRKRKGVTVTVCVAAMCSSNILLGASDRMLTSGDVEFEPATAKIYNPTNSTVIMIAGESSLQAQILNIIYPWASERIKHKPEEWIRIEELADKYYRGYQSIRSSQAEMRVLGPLGMTLDSFIKRQREMTPEIVKELTQAIVNFEMPDIEAIVAGIDDTGVHLYIVTNNGVVCRDAIGFAAIGIGYWHANSQFMFAEHNRERPLPETLLLTYAAKKRAEVAPGVGIGTDMFTMGPNLGSYFAILPQVIQDVDKIYKRTRTRAKTSIEKANKEVNKYVEQLSKAATAQEQKTATPKPAPDQSGGKETGEADTGTGRPN